MVKKYRKKPVEVEAVRWDGSASSTSKIVHWILANSGEASYVCSDPFLCEERGGESPHSISIRTLEGTMTVSFGDYVIRGVQGEFYPCKPDIFEQTYEEI